MTKAQRTLLLKFLRTFNDLRYTKSNVSNSEYFSNKVLVIRLSDHVRHMNVSSKALLNIISAYGSSDFIVFANDQPIIAKSVTEVKALIRTSLIITGAFQYAEDTVRETKIAKLRSTIEEQTIKFSASLKDAKKQIKEFKMKCEKQQCKSKTIKGKISFAQVVQTNNPSFVSINDNGTIIDINMFTEKQKNTIRSYVGQCKNKGISK